MAEDIFEVKRERFDLLRPEIYLLQGTWPEGYRVEAYLKKQQISGEVMPWDYVSVLERVVAHEHEGTKRVSFFQNICPFCAESRNLPFKALVFLFAVFHSARF